MSNASHNPVPTGERRTGYGRIAKVIPWLLAVAAILIALKLSETPMFMRISFVVSDEIARRAGPDSSGRIVLIRLDQSLPKPNLELMLSKAIPTLIDNYQAQVLGIDIDFSRDQYDTLAKGFAEAAGRDHQLVDRVVWAADYVGSGQSNESYTGEDTPFCKQCSGVSCKVRFTPKPVFGGSESTPTNYGFAVAFPDVDGVNRSAARFLCHSLTEAPIHSFHFKLVKVYCENNVGTETCRNLDPYSQARTQIYSWYHTEPLDLCALVRCFGPDAGSKNDHNHVDMTGKILILYSDIAGNDEHMTLEGTRKGAEIVASLAENELRFGVNQAFWVSALEWGLKAFLTGVLLFLFHWKYTQSWAILPAIGIFVLYLRLVPALATLVPDFRNYVLAIVLGFWLEVLLKAFWSNAKAFVTAVRSAVSSIVEKLSERQKKEHKTSQPGTETPPAEMGPAGQIAPDEKKAAGARVVLPEEQREPEMVDKRQGQDPSSGDTTTNMSRPSDAATSSPPAKP